MAGFTFTAVTAWLCFQVRRLSPYLSNRDAVRTFREVLARLELKHLSQLDGLYHLMHNTALRLENLDGDNVVQGSTLAARPTMDISGTEIRDDSPLVYVVQAEAKPVVMRVENNSRGIQKAIGKGLWLD